MREKARSIGRAVPVTVAFLTIVPVAAHLIYSWMGFSPTDQGFTLAYSRRIVEGQVPHLDFIIIRPPLSPLIHTPFILFGGAYTFWLSRLFVWFEFAVIAWAWVSAVDRVSGRPFSAPMKTLLGLAAFAATAQHFLLSAWHTTDGLFLSAIGAWLAVTRRGSGARFSGYLLVGAAYLTKQSFILMPLLFLIVLGDWRRPRYWAASAIPGLVYVAYLLATGAFPDAFAQLTSQTGIFSAGVTSYLNYAVALGFVAGAASMLALSAGDRLPSGLPLGGGRLAEYRLPESAGALGLVVLPAGAITVGMVLDGISTVAFGVFGMVLGAVVVKLWAAFRREGLASRTDASRIALLALVAAWSASLSFGYNTPGLGLGIMFAVLVASAYPYLLSLGPGLVRPVFVVAALAVILSFGWSRTEYIYRDLPAGQLTEPVGDVLPGGRMIYTNPQTYAFLADLKQAKGIATKEGEEYAIIPQAAGYWAQADQTNPLPIDWPWSVELANERLNDRVKRDLDSERGQTAVLVQKVDAFELAYDPPPITNGRYEIVDYVRDNWKKTAETEYFEIYE